MRTERAKRGLAAKGARLEPTQKRSRERLEKILGCAEQLLLEKGSDALRMSDIVERAGVPFGSLYQYFPDKTAIIGTLAKRYNAIVNEGAGKAFEAMRSAEDLHPVLCHLTDGYYEWYRKEPVLAAIWQATLADRALQDIDRDDCEYLAGLLRDAARPFVDDEPEELETFSRLAITLIGATVRYAITLDETQAQRVLAQFKAMLPDRPGGGEKGAGRGLSPRTR
ncbi:MAG: TetR/AcrR family transcriptional regulator [Burkholderiaceae bacterium]